jgi:hypothetical protein
VTTLSHRWSLGQAWALTDEQADKPIAEGTNEVVARQKALA